MNIQMTYRFIENRYNIKNELCNKDINNCITYDYFGKDNKKYTVLIKILNSDEYALLGNDILIQNGNGSIALVEFSTEVEYENFQMPTWIEKFPYVE